MIRSLFILAFFCSLLSCNEGSDEKEVKPVEEIETGSRHSEEFNVTVDTMMNAYYELTEAFVKWDSADVTSKGKKLDSIIGNFSLNELRTDSTNDIFNAAVENISNARLNLSVITNEDSLELKRHQLNDLTGNLYNFLRTVKYDEKKIYLQQCPMAFNDEDPGVWLSEVDSIRNPYLGLYHPRYGKGMLACGDNKATVDYTGEK